MRLQGVDDEAAAFCREIRPRLVGALGLYCGSSAGEELAQETLLRVWEHWETVRLAASPEAWAFRTGFNVASSWFRRQSAERRARARLSSRPEVVSDPATTLAVRAAVAGLPSRQRKIIVLRYFADLPIAEVATILDCAPGTVKSLTHNALGLLRARFAFEIEEEDVERV
jgi:RNA polymerase sigma factor (sigma-70 family)